jgi:transglutaminase-like putative cysteine protease
VQSTVQQYLAPTWFLDSDSAEVRAYAEEAVAGAATDRERAVRLFYRVRDGIRYDPYSVSMVREDYRASRLTTARSAYCVPKAVLLAAAGRAAGVPARLGFGDVRNHLASPKLLALLRTDVFVFHGFAEFFLGGRWVKATPAFNIELCRKVGVLALEFDGVEDCLYQPHDAAGRRHMEYIRQRGSYADLPFDEMMRVGLEFYGSVRPEQIAASAQADPTFRPGREPE